MWFALYSSLHTRIRIIKNIHHNSNLSSKRASFLCCHVMCHFTACSWGAFVRNDVVLSTFVITYEWRRHREGSISGDDELAGHYARLTNCVRPDPQRMMMMNKWDTKNYENVAYLRPLREHWSVTIFANQGGRLVTRK